MNIILLGPPGAGKGTQAQFIVKKYKYFQLSTGDILRDEIKKKTKLGNKIDKLISKGHFVSDNIVETLLKEILINSKNKDRIIFDGYPRNINQAQNLNKILKELNHKIYVVIYLNVTRDIVNKRIIGRVTCDKCKITLNEYFNKDEINSHTCGKENLKKRIDDSENIALKRYDTYILQTKPVLDFYSNQENFYEIDGALKIEQISNKIIKILNV